MSGSGPFYDQGTEKVKLAIAADNGSDYTTAINLYKNAITLYVTGMKYDQNPSSKKMVEDKTKGYMERAEFLKTIMDKQANSPKGTMQAGESSSATKRKDADTKEDDEKSKLRGALSSAIVSEKPNVKWDDVAGLEGAKEALKEAVILPIKFPQFFTGKRVPWKGILLYGPPGTGKSFLAKAVATEADSTFYSVSSSDLVSKWQGESERLVKQMFEMARESRPSIIFIDEIDSLCTARSEGESESSRRIKTEFLVQMDGVGSAKGGLLVLGATNVPWELDPAMRRRFEKRVYIALPEAPARTNMFKLNLGDTPNDISPNEFELLGESASGYSGSDIAVVVREALMEPLRKCQIAKQFLMDREGFFNPCHDYPNCPYCPMQLSTQSATEKVCRSCGAVRMTLFDVPSDKLRVPLVTMADFHKALHRSHSSVGVEELEKFVQWTGEFGSDG